MKSIHLILILFLTSFLVSSCYEETYWVDENVTSDGKHFPVISVLSVDNVPESGEYAAGEVAKVDVFYWSIDDIQEVQLKQTIGEVETMVSSQPYAANFDDMQQTDKMTFDYTVPANPDTLSLEVGLTVTVVNVNGLTRDKSTGIVVQPD